MTAHATPKIWLFMLIMPLAAIIVLMLTPALPKIHQYFVLKNASTSNVVSIAMFGYALGPLLLGPISNAFGRKKALYIGLLVAFFGLVLQWVAAMLWRRYDIFLIGRFISPLGAVVGIVMTYAMVADVFTGAKARQMMSYAVMSFAVMPGVSVAIGGLLTEHFNFTAIIIFCIAYIIVAFIAIYYSPETLTKEKQDRQQLAPNLIIRNYAVLWKSPTYVIFYILIGFCAAILYVYGALAPIVCIHLLHLSASQFGLIGFFPYLAFMLALLLNGKLGGIFSTKAIYIFSITLMLGASILLWLLLISGIFNVIAFFIPICLLFFAVGPCIANSAVIANNSVTDKGSASAMGCFIFMVIGSFGTLISGVFQGSLPTALPIIFMIFSLLILGLYLLGKNEI